jgi:ubiquinone/menaquinone biosynthesis C-methylase UbiE
MSLTEIKDLDAHIAAERERHDRQYSAVADRNLLVKYGAEYAPSDLRAGLVYAFDQLGDLRGKHVLEIGAGSGWDAVILVYRGASVVATDVSPVGLEMATRRFAVNSMADRAEVLEMAAERLDFPDESFDHVFGHAVLHHLDMTKAPHEIDRVLRPGGRAVFLEPLSENPVLDFARDYAPYPGKKSPKGHRGISYDVIREMGRFVPLVEMREFYLTSMVNRAFGHHTSITPLETLDRFLLDRVPKLRRFSRYIVVAYRKPAGP